MKNKVFLALGANVGDRKKNLLSAVYLLKEELIQVKVAPIYESMPVGFKDQPNFLNTVISGYTKLKPLELLKFIKSIEKKIGRVKRFHWGPREIDIDILFYNDLVYKDEELEIPHPRLHKRDFVLRPLSYLAPDFIHPFLKKKAKELLLSIPKGALSIVQRVN